jgi:hypothetical protein
MVAWDTRLWEVRTSRQVIQYLKDGVDVSANQMAYFYCLRDAAQDERSRPQEAIYLLVLSRSVRYLGYSRDNTYRGSSELLYCYNSSLHSCLRTALLYTRIVSID